METIKTINVTIGEETKEIECTRWNDSHWNLPYGIIEVKTEKGSKWHKGYGNVTEDGIIYNIGYHGMRGNGVGKKSTITQIRWAV